MSRDRAGTVFLEIATGTLGAEVRLGRADHALGVSVWDRMPWELPTVPLTEADWISELYAALLALAELRA